MPGPLYALAHSVTARWLVMACALLLTACSAQVPQTASLPAHDSDASQQNANTTIALLGATGLAGGYILDQALAEGYQVRALARSPQKLERYAGRISIVMGDALDPDAINALLQGAQVVVSALGPVKADGDAASMLNSRVTAQLLELMPQHRVERYIQVSGAAVVVPTDERDLSGWFMRQLVIISLNAELKDKQAEYALLADSTADWTLVRCPLIDDEPYLHPPLVSLTTPPSFSLRAGELADFVVQQVDSADFVRQAPFLGSH